jgi:short subunit dehydrogenase-like uncharacterized protein
MNTKPRILLYGATGYTGRLLAESAGAQELPMVLAGRDAEALAELSERVGLPYVAFSLETPQERALRLQRGNTEEASARAKVNQAIDRALQQVGVVLNAAGPFGLTAEPLARACMRSGAHYVDISGEYDVFGRLRTLYDDAQRPPITLVPGAGFTVLGSDALLREAYRIGRESGMTGPHVVRVALSRVPVISRGSAKTMLAAVREGVRVHQNGKPVTLPVGTLVRSFAFGFDDDFGSEELRICTAMTLADAKTVEQTLGVAVPNVETYVEATSLEQLSYELGGEMALLLRSFPVRRSLDYALSFWPEGPTRDERHSSSAQVVVELEDRYRRAVLARLLTPNTYDFTVKSALAIATKLLVAAPAAGVLSPSRVLGLAELEATDPSAFKNVVETRGFRSASRLTRAANVQ